MSSVDLIFSIVCGVSLVGYGSYTFYLNHITVELDNGSNLFTITEVFSKIVSAIFIIAGLFVLLEPDVMKSFYFIYP